MPLAHFVFGIGPGETTPAEGAEGVSYPVRVRVVVLDGAEHTVANIDTALVFRLDRPLGRGQYLIGRAELPLPAGDLAVPVRPRWRRMAVLGLDRRARRR